MYSSDISKFLRLDLTEGMQPDNVVIIDRYIYHISFLKRIIELWLYLNRLTQNDINISNID